MSVIPVVDGVSGSVVTRNSFQLQAAFIHRAHTRVCGKYARVELKGVTMIPTTYSRCTFLLSMLVVLTASGCRLTLVPDGGEGSPNPDDNGSGQQGGAIATCGDGLCQADETVETCSQDCDEPVSCVFRDDCGLNEACRNGTCERFEGPDAGFAPNVCGNEYCEYGEDLRNCDEDCLAFADGEAVCGDGYCELGERFGSCANDCSESTPREGVCGNESCELGETTDDCPFDCRNGDIPGGMNCGNGICDAGESASSCDVDCDDASIGSAFCGDMICEAGETTANCPTDCGTRDAECFPVCASSLDCDDNDPCTTDSCEVGPNTCFGSVCSNDPIDCPPGESCVNGICRIEMVCFSDAECALTQVCDTGVCVTP